MISFQYFLQIGFIVFPAIDTIIFREIQLLIFILIRFTNIVINFYILIKPSLHSFYYKYLLFNTCVILFMFFLQTHKCRAQMSNCTYLFLKIRLYIIIPSLSFAIQFLNHSWKFSILLLSVSNLIVCFLITFNFVQRAFKF